jgi:FHA domain
MPICPRGHDSAAADYCDECGIPIGTPVTPAPVGPTPVVAPAASAASSGTAAASSGPAASAAPTGEVCPDCATARDGRFCEVCGWDFLAEAPPPERSQAHSALPAAWPNQVAPAGAWRLVASADRAYYARMTAATPGAQMVAFPAFCPDRRFALDGHQLLIGRRSRSRGIEPDIDLTGPPEDAGVSHAHALLVSTPEGGWSVVDLDSANGTYFNDGTDPIQPNVPVAINDGDRIHVGAWTTLTVHAG